MWSLPDVSRKIRKSPVLRILAYPVILAWRFYVQIRYYSSNDYIFIKSLKDKHKGGRCFITGNGPSLTGADLEKIKGEITFSSNRIYKLFDKTSWRPDYYMVTDGEILLTEKESIENLIGPTKFVMKTMTIKPIRFSKNCGVHWIITRDKFYLRNQDYIKKNIGTDCSKGFSKSESVTHRMIELAIYMGFNEIYLIGCDNKYPVSINRNGSKRIDKSVKDHFDGGGFATQSMNYIYIDASNSCYQAYKDYADAHGIKIFNATRGGELEIFDRIDLDQLYSAKVI